MKPQYLLIGGVGLAAVAFFALQKKDQAPAYDIPAADTLPEPTTTTPAPVKLNNALLLKKGMAGAEVKQLQSLLGIAADGLFGAQTESALLAKKGVKQITLGSYNSTADINTAALPQGTKVMANAKPGAKLYEITVAADGTYHNTGKLLTTWDFGTEIGKIVAVSSPSKSHYVVEFDNWFTAWVKTYVWVAASEVKKL